MLEITDEDIASVEAKFKLSFDDESKEFIKCLESKDIQACPGAGKTTSLVAKLDILANSMPFDDNSGILVLTHTNVAVDEIRKKLGANAKKVLGYPNHVGTFQSFINKYLAIPMYINLFGNKPERIDSVAFNEKLISRLGQYYLDKFVLLSSEANNFSNIEYFLKSLVVEKNRVALRQTGGRKKTIVNKGKPSYRNIKRALGENIIESVIVDGYLSYEHCYEMAELYLETYPKVANVFQNLFRNVFIDEVQDTDDKQFSIIENLFENRNVVVQKIGDNNQSIYNFLGKKEKGWEIKDSHIEIKDTKRLSKKIADTAKKVALKPQNLSGNEDIKIKPTIIVFDDKNIEKVIPRFSELIIENKLHKEKEPIFKAIAGVAKENENGHVLSDYFPSYKKTSNTADQMDFATQLKDIDFKTVTPKDYRKILLEIVLEYLKKAGVKNENDKPFTKRSLLWYLKEIDTELYDDVKKQLLKIVSKWYSKKYKKSDLKILLKNILVVFDPEYDSEILSDIIADYKINVENNKSLNTYSWDKKKNKFKVSVSTIHKVKGETHTATLVLETFHNGYDISQLLDCFKGKKKTGLIDKKKLIYVAMTRATHFLCLAIHKKYKRGKKTHEISDDDIKQLKKNGFEVVAL